MNMKFVLFTILNVHVQFHARIQREWEGGPEPQQYWSASPKNGKAFKPAIIVGSSSARQQNE